MDTASPISAASDALAGEHSADENSHNSQLHDLIPFVIRDHAFAVFTDQVEGTVESKPFAPLPRAPAGVIGVTCVHGRMLTVLDPAALLESGVASWPRNLPHVIALRGEEQFALAAEICRDTITVSAEDIERGIETKLPADVAVGLVRYGGEEILVLDTNKLVNMAVQHKERRRRRF